MRNLYCFITIIIIFSSCKKNEIKSEFENLSVVALNEKNNVNKISDVLNLDIRISTIFQLNSDLRQQLKVNRNESNYSEFINLLSSENRIDSLNSFFNKPENNNLKNIGNILNKINILKFEIQSDYPYLVKLDKENMNFLAESSYDNYLKNKSNNNITKALMGFGDMCTDTYHRSNSRCERNGDIGMFFCTFTLPSGLGYVACVGLVVITTANCFNDAEEDFRFCQKK